MLVYIFFLSTIFTSFFNLIIEHFHQNLPLIWNRSKCPYCQHILQWYDLVPIFSQCLLKGKCRYCQHKFSYAHSISEACMGILAVLIYQYSNYPFYNLILLFFFYLHFLSDLFYQELYTYPFYIFSGCIITIHLYYHWPLYPWQATLFILCLLPLCTHIDRAIGFGDLLFITLLFLIYPYRWVLMLLFLASILGIIFFLLSYLQHIPIKQLPFLPFIILSWIYLLI